MFSFLKKSKKIASPMSGEVISIEKIEDQVFSQKLLGDGFGVKPTSDDVFSPVDGVISQVFETKHAVCITSNDGLEILVHLGIDTVYLKGEGFDVVVQEGDKVTTGQKIVTMDIKSIAAQDINTTCCVILTNSDEFSLETIEGTAVGGKTEAMKYSSKN